MLILDKGLPEDGGKGLKGVGPATALICLSLFSVSVPYFSDEVFMAVCGKPPKSYSISEVMEFCNKLHEQYDPTKFNSIEELEQSIWATEILKNLPATLTSKRKLEEHGHEQKEKIIKIR